MGMSVVLWDHFVVIGYPGMKRHSKLKQKIDTEKMLVYTIMLRLLEYFKNLNIHRLFM